MPVVFVSHGAPTLAIEKNDAHRFLRTFGKQLGRPRGILVVSAHFDAPVATVTAAASPRTIHDFGGFPRELYEMTYPAPGSPKLAGDIVELLAAAEVPTRATASRGLDHGAWIPLSLMYPKADIPVVQVSIDPRRGSGYHLELGRHLAPLRDEGVLIMGSGGVTHNLRELAWEGGQAGTPQWAAAFNEWVAEVIAAGRIDDLLAYRDLAPDAARNHPTEEHFFPLLCALGATSGDERRARVHHSYTMGALSMDAYQFGDSPGQTQ
jgi:4,5-DOPA dioxygenase extradiol